MSESVQISWIFHLKMCINCKQYISRNETHNLKSETENSINCAVQVPHYASMVMFGEAYKTLSISFNDSQLKSVSKTVSQKVSQSVLGNSNKSDHIPAARRPLTLQQRLSLLWSH